MANAFRPGCLAMASFMRERYRVSSSSLVKVVLSPPGWNKMWCHFLRRHGFLPKKVKLRSSISPELQKRESRRMYRLHIDVVVELGWAFWLRTLKRDVMPGATLVSPIAWTTGLRSWNDMLKPCWHLLEGSKGMRLQSTWMMSLPMRFSLETMSIRSMFQFVDGRSSGRIQT